MGLELHLRAYFTGRVGPVGESVVKVEISVLFLDNMLIEEIKKNMQKCLGV